MGARLLYKKVLEPYLALKLALISMCVGIGQGCTMVIENVS
jgi:acetyl-CoA acetyltransferase